MHSSASTKSTQLSPRVHGRGCSIGELRLTKEELKTVNAIIKSAGFRFTPRVDVLEEEPKKPVKEEAEQTPVSRPKRAVRARRVVASVVQEPSPAAPASKRRRTNTPTPVTKKSDSSVSAPQQPPPAPQAPTPSPTPAKPAAAETNMDKSGPQQIVLKTDPSLYTTTVVPILHPQKKKSHFVVHSQDLVWENVCGVLLNILERNPQSKWFAIPVDPQVQGLQDYYDKIKTPMDLQTVRQKLEGGMYCHPFRWQHDVRTIFFNAFLYHPPDTPVWRSAAELAVTFENLCKEMIEANPYCVFVRPPPAPPPQAPQPNVAESADVVAKTIPSAATINTTQDDIEPATVTETYGSVGFAPLGRKSVPAHTSKAKRSTPPGVKIKEPGNVVTYTADCAGTELARYYEEHLPVSALPDPKLSQGTGLEGGAQNRAGGVSNSQKKNLPARFRELDVFYRKALLDWVKDELGIHSLLCALDVRYVPDLDLLPPVKAKQFFVHMKSLMTQQKQAQDESFLPTTLPRVLSWDIAYNSEQSTSQLQPPAQPLSPSPMELTTPPPSQPPLQQMVTAASQISTPHRASWAVPNRDQESSEEESSEESSSSEEESSSEDGGGSMPSAQPGGTTLWHKPGGMSWGGLGKQRTMPPLANGLGLWRQSGGYATSAPAQPPSIEHQSSCWGEWKARAMQHDFQLRAKVRKYS